MDQRDLARLLVKITGLLIMAYTLVLLPYHAAATLPFLQRPNVRSDWADLGLLEVAGIIIVPALIAIGVGLCLFLGSGRIVNRYLIPGGQDRPIQATDLRGVEEVAVAVLGFYFLADGLGDTVTYATQAISFTLQSGHGWPIPLTALAAGMKLVIGIALMLRSQVFVAVRRGLIALRPMARDR
jgi:hypothetical protein